MYLPIIIMLVVALTAGILIWLDILHVDQIIAAVNDNRPLAALVILALFAFKGCSCIPYAVILIGCALIFELPVAIAINTVGTVICISVSYLIGRFSKGLTFDGMMEKYPKFRRYFSNAEGYSFTFRFLYKGIIIKHNKTEPTYTKTSLFLCEKRRFFMARTEKGGKFFLVSQAGRSGFFHFKTRRIANGR